MISFRRTTSTSSSRYTSASTTASVSQVSEEMAVHSLRVTRGTSRYSKTGIADRYYRAIVSASSVPPWDMLTEYTDCQLVGKGSYGDVCRAQNNSRSMAVKRVDILEDDCDSDWENGLRLVREIHFLKHLNHPNLSKLVNLFPNKDYFDDPQTDCLKTIYVVTEYCPGGSLNGYSLNSISEILSIHYQVLTALEYLHAHNILHRDIKRENIFIRHNRGGRTLHAIVGDFGLARTRIECSMTSEVVTKPYRCPSLLLGETNYGGEIDVYATGIVLAEMLFGRLNSTLLPNRKMGPKNFLKYQYALARRENETEQSFGPRLSALAAQMHVDLENVYESPFSADYDDQVIQEWSRMVWNKIKTVEGICDKTIDMLRSMIAIDPKQRPSVAQLLRQQTNLKTTVLGGENVLIMVSESFDDEISVHKSDKQRAAAVKEKIASMIREFSTTGSVTTSSVVELAAPSEPRRCSLRLSQKRTISQV
jgi:serine/threonine protein kinase